MARDLLLVSLLLVAVIRLVVVVAVLFVVVVFLFLQGAQGGGLGKPGNVVVAGLAGEGVDVPSHVAAAAVDSERPVSAVAVVGAAQVEGAVGALGHLVRDAAGADIDHAADGAGAVEQGGRALQHFHALGDVGVDRDRVVAAAHGDIKGVDPFLHDPHARAAEAVDDGAPRAGAVGTVVDAGLVAHGRADVVHRLAFEFVGCQHIARLRESVACEGVCQDDDLLDDFLLRRCFDGERGCREPRRSRRRE